MAVAPDGATARYLAHGTLTGDWGGGIGLGSAVMWHAMRGWDGRGPATALGAAVAAHFGLASVRDVAVAMHQGELGEADLIKLSAVLFAVAADGDPVARVPGDAAGDGDPADGGRRDAAARPGAGRVTVVLGGGLLESRDPLLGEIGRQLAAAAPGRCRARARRAAGGGRRAARARPRRGPTAKLRNGAHEPAQREADTA